MFPMTMAVPTVEHALGPLINWIKAVVSAGDYLAKNGGAAPTISRQEPPDLVSSVVTVSDGHTELEEESEAAGRGYKAASAQLLDAAPRGLRLPLRRETRLNSSPLRRRYHTIRLHLQRQRGPRLRAHIFLCL